MSGRFVFVKIGCVLGDDNINWIGIRVFFFLMICGIGVGF